MKKSEPVSLKKEAVVFVISTMDLQIPGLTVDT